MRHLQLLATVLFLAVVAFAQTTDWQQATPQETGLPTALTHFESPAFPPINPQTCRQNALRFNWPTFRAELIDAIQKVVPTPSSAS